MSVGLLYHNDLDGLISAMILLASQEIKIDRAFPIDYGKDISNIKEQCDKFIILDYADNITEDKTVLWIDHHIHEGKDIPEYAIIKSSPSCARLVNDFLEVETISEEDLSIIDSIDSASFKFSKKFTPVDVLFPDTTTRKGQWIALNQILMKNRKTNLCNHLLEDLVFDPASMLLKIEKMGKGIKPYSKYEERKQDLMEKIMNNINDYCVVLSGIPVILTKKFQKEDWYGYDRNLFYFLHKDYPYCIITFDMSTGFSFQVSRNMFYSENYEESVLEKIKDAIEDEARGHEGIINFYFENSEDGLKKIDHIIDLLAT